ncbi:hypothetical protein [Thiothrix subterranea]|uniref:hypothetical protein n=1 Tax=Thiothrix subterranea TaxID=2735563 RepID=UPI00280B7330|nr:hypothetical protein [Thiothrix subterranea]
MQAAEIAASIGDAKLTNTYLAKVPASALDGENRARQAYVKALLALQQNNPRLALRSLPTNLDELSPLCVKKSNTFNNALKQWPVARVAAHPAFKMYKPLSSLTASRASPHSSRNPAHWEVSGKKSTGVSTPPVTALPAKPAYKFMM